MSLRPPEIHCEFWPTLGQAMGLSETNKHILVSCVLLAAIETKSNVPGSLDLLLEVGTETKHPYM